MVMHTLQEMPDDSNLDEAPLSQQGGGGCFDAAIDRSTRFARGTIRFHRRCMSAVIPHDTFALTTHTLFAVCSPHPRKPPLIY
jgi:hypothetical protein